MIATEPGELTVADAARLLRVAPLTIRRWCVAGRLAARHRGGFWFPRLTAVTALRRQHRRVARLVADA